MNKLAERFKKILNKKWYIQGFNGCLNFCFGAPQSGLVGCHKNLGYGYTEKVFIFNKDYVEYLYLEEDFKNIGNTFLEKYKKDKNYLKEVMEKDAVIVASSKKIMSNIDNTDLTRLNKQELVKLYQEMQNAYHGILDVSHIIEGISFVIEPLLKKKIEEALKIDRHEPEFRNIFNLLMQPAKPSFANEEYIDILEIVKLVKKNNELLSLFRELSPSDIAERLKIGDKKIIEKDKRIIEKIRLHRKKFLYNQINYYHGNPLSELDYISEIKKLIEEKFNIENIDEKIKAEKERYPLNAKTREEIIKKYNFNDEIISLINISMVVLHWQDNRKKNILTGVYYMNLLLCEIGRRYNIPLEKIKRYLPEEITEDKLDNFNVNDANERMKHYIVYSKRENGKMIFEIYTKEDYKNIIDIYNKTYAEQNDVHGASASPGKIIGVVRVCKTKEDLLKFKEGEILVASMTRPEFVPAMKKALAIVTDEGGLTCHASIVSRELGKPCIVGTKIGTKVLKDGDMVEVNANHGTVKRIK